MIKKFETYIKENKGDDEIIYIKDLYDKYRFLFHMSLELKRMIKDKYIKIQSKINGEWKDIINDYKKVENVSIMSIVEQLQRGISNYDVLIQISNGKSECVIHVNKEHRILVKPPKIVINEEDPYGEEDWGDD